MYSKIKSIIYFLILILFFSSTVVHYFSEENKKKIYKNRNNISKNIEKKTVQIPLLKNDTENIIEYNSSDFKDKKIKKRYFWELLKKD
tara:strand:+ start:262 stop:525 length:264 start_codon:yes stop_codon:yes gene_type:complete